MPKRTASEAELIVENANLKLKLKMCHSAMKETFGGLDSIEEYAVLLDILKRLKPSDQNRIAIGLAEAFLSTGGLK